MNNIWFDRIYYMFGFLFICYGIMIITCAAVTIMFVYYLLCAENYRWQWRAFNSAGAGAGFVFAFSIIYWMWKLRFAGLTSAVLYIGYSSLISFLFYILTGMFHSSKSRASLNSTQVPLASFRAGALYIGSTDPFVLIEASKWQMYVVDASSWRCRCSVLG